MNDAAVGEEEQGDGAGVGQAVGQASRFIHRNILVDAQMCGSVVGNEIDKVGQLIGRVLVQSAHDEAFQQIQHTEEASQTELEFTLKGSAISLKSAEVRGLLEAFKSVAKDVANFVV